MGLGFCGSRSKMIQMHRVQRAGHPSDCTEKVILKTKKPVMNSSQVGAPRGTRTPGLLVRSQSLYPAELLAHNGVLFRMLSHYSILMKGLSTVFRKKIAVSEFHQIQRSNQVFIKKRFASSINFRLLSWVTWRSASSIESHFSSLISFS